LVEGGPGDWFKMHDKAFIWISQARTESPIIPQILLKFVSPECSDVGAWSIVKIKRRVNCVPVPSFHTIEGASFKQASIHKSQNLKIGFVPSGDL
jgi:hypothetical protein